MDDHRLMIERFFADELSPEEEEALRERIRRSPELKAEYDRAAILLRTAAEAEPPARETERIWQRVERALNAPRDAAAKPAAAPTPWPRWLPAMAALLLIGLTVLLVYNHRAPQTQLRGGTGKGSAAGSGSASAGLLAPRVDFDVHGIRFELRKGYGRPRPVDAGGTLTLKDYVQFRYVNEDRGLRYLALGGLLRPAAGAKPTTGLLYYPRPRSSAPLEIGLAPALKGVGRSLRLSARHSPGELTIVAVFSARPQSRQRLERNFALLAERARRRQPLDAPPLSWDGPVRVVWHRFTVVEDESR